MSWEEQRANNVDEDVLREFAAEIKRLTNFPLSDKIVEAAIKNMKPK